MAPAKGRRTRNEERSLVVVWAVIVAQCPTFAEVTSGQFFSNPFIFFCRREEAEVEVDHFRLCFHTTGVYADDRSIVKKLNYTKTIPLYFVVKGNGYIGDGRRSSCVEDRPRVRQRMRQGCGGKVQKAGLRRRIAGAVEVKLLQNFLG